MTSILPAAPPGAAAAPAGASLDFEQARCERQLADWKHCVSAKTPYGKAKIEELSDRLGTIKAKVEHADAMKSETRASSAVPPAGAIPAPVRSPGALGGQIDVYA